MGASWRLIHKNGKNLCPNRLQTRERAWNESLVAANLSSPRSVAIGPDEEEMKEGATCPTVCVSSSAARLSLSEKDSGKPRSPLFLLCWISETWNTRIELWRTSCAFLPLF